MNNPPFAIGQKVVCINGYPGYWRKGEIYTVASIYPCSKCGEWHIQTLETPVDRHCDDYTCSFCQSLIIGEPTNHYGTDAKSFAPIQTNYADATSEILEKFKSPNEVPDKILIPETI